MAICDPKYAIWLMLRNRYNELMEEYPDKIDVKVTTAYPRTVEEIDKKALITVSRVTAPEEMRFVSDLITRESETSVSIGGNQSSTFGAIQTDIFEIAIWTLDAQYRDDLYLLARQLLFENKKTDLYKKFQFIKFYRIGGGDQELDVAKLPRTLYRAVLTYLVSTKMEYGSTDDLVQDMTITTTIIPSGF